MLVEKSWAARALFRLLLKPLQCALLHRISTPSRAIDGFTVLALTSTKYSIKRNYAISTNNATPTDINLNLIPLHKIRNVGIIAHIDAGKTTTTERMLYYSGSIKQIGDVDQGDTITDYLPAERDRGITIQSAAVTMPWNQSKINVIDTPGHVDFTFEVIRSLRVLDGAVTILDAVAGVEAQTEKVWKQAKSLRLPSVVYINKMDRMGSGFSRTCRDIITKLRTKIVLVNIPYFVENKETRELIFSGVVDVLNKKLLKWDLNAEGEDGSKITVVDLEQHKDTYPQSYQELCKARESAIETLCEFDDNLVDAFLESEEDYMKVSAKDINTALRQATISDQVAPVLCGASFKNIGVQPLLDAVIDYLPNPNETRIPEITSKFSNTSNKKKRSVRNDKQQQQNSDSKQQQGAQYAVPAKTDPASGLLVNNNNHLSLGLAFKVITDYRKAPMIFVRVYSGRIQNGGTVLNTRTGKKFRITNLFLINGNTTQHIDKLTCGNIGVITASLVSSADDSSGANGSSNGSESMDANAHLGSGANSVHLSDINEIKTGDTLLTHFTKKDGLKSFKGLETGIALNPIAVPPSIFITSLEPRTLNDKRILDENLKILLREDPSLRVFENEEGQTLISGMGELHLEIVKDRLINDMKTNCEISKVMVTYKETLLNLTPIINRVIEGGKEEGDDFVIEFEIVPFDGPVEEHPLYEDDACIALPNNDNLVHIPLSAAPESVQQFINNESNENNNNSNTFWPLQVKYEQVINAIVSSCISTLQNGGAIANLPLNSVMISVRKWNVPKNAIEVKTLLTLTRDAVLESLRQLNPENDFTILEPIMNIQVFASNEDLGKVSHDLTSSRKAEIMAIEDEAEVSFSTSSAEAVEGEEEDAVDYIKEAEKQYLPYDPTLPINGSVGGSSTGASGNERLQKEVGAKVIYAYAPLREMIGYLSKLRSLTKGRSTFLMEYQGLRKVTKDRLDKIREDI